ncbi:MAG: hypothetical protein ABR586_09705 [Thermoplasmatota archaeon]
MSADSERLAIRTDELLQKLWRPDAPPPALWHFTTSGAAENIQRSRELWARNLKQLHKGDYLEFRLGWRVIQAIAEALSEDNDELTARVAQLIAKDPGPFGEQAQFDAFVFCFTDAGNRRAVRSYFGEKGSTDYLEFEIRKLLAGLRHQARRGQHSMQLMQVRYNLETLIEIAEKLIRELSVLARSNLVMAYGPLRHALVTVALSFKRPSYQIESEWRLIVTEWHAETAGMDRFPLCAMTKTGKHLPLPCRGGTFFRERPPP